MAEYLFCDGYASRTDIGHKPPEISLYVLDTSELDHNGIAVCNGEYFVIRHKINHQGTNWDYVDDTGVFCCFGDNDCEGYDCGEYGEECHCEHDKIYNGIYHEIRFMNLSPVKVQPISEAAIVKAAFPQLNKNKTERGNTMKNENMFSNVMPAFNFGPVNDGRIKMSVSGLAVRATDGNYLAYQNGSVTDVTPMLIDMPGMIFAMPVSTKAISQGDYIDHQGKIYIVVEVLDDSLDCIDVATSTKVGVVPVKNVFGFNFYTKYMTPMGGLFADGEVNEDNPFGGFGKIMMMQTLLGGGMFGQNGGDNSNFFQMMMLSKMMGGGDFDFDKMF